LLQAAVAEHMGRLAAVAVAVQWLQPLTQCYLDWGNGRQWQVRQEPTAFWEQLVEV
jgi:hypothetical protein